MTNIGDTAGRQLMYSIEDAAKITALGRTKLYALLVSGEIESVMVGRRRLVPHDALVAFVAKLRQQQHTA